MQIGQQRQYNKIESDCLLNLSIYNQFVYILYINGIISQHI